LSAFVCPQAGNGIFKWLQTTQRRVFCGIEDYVKFRVLCHWDIAILVGLLTPMDALVLGW
jgi:hypothetical protein